MLIQIQFYQKFILNLLLALLPISFIAGNLILNSNIVLIILYSFFLFHFKIFKEKLTLTDKLVIILFTYILINGFLNNFLNFNFTDVSNENIVLIKSLSFLRFFFLYFVIKFLVIKNFINYKFIFLIFGSCSLLVSLDIIFQFFNGVDVFGYESSGRRLSGPFGEELIAGSFIQRFFIFLPLLFIIFFRIKNKIIFNLLIFISLAIILAGILLSGNRMPILMLMIMLVLLFFYENKLRKNLSVIFLLFSITICFLIFEKSKFRPHYLTFIAKSAQIVDYAKQRIFYGKVEVKNVYVKEIESGILTWQKNKYFGGGIDSFRWNCNSVDRSKMLSFISKRGNVNCNNHPHNYYLEIASELGLVGLFIVLIIFGNIIFNIFKLLHFSKVKPYSYEILKVFFIVFIVEIFPLKTTGSFFSTFNANFIFIILPIIVGLIENKREINNESR